MSKEVVYFKAFLCGVQGSGDPLVLALKFVCSDRRPILSDATNESLSTHNIVMDSFIMYCWLPYKLWDFFGEVSKPDTFL